jgi:glutathione S-transferase
MKLELISFELCPYVQRAVIVLKHKGARFSVKYVDLENPPAWFEKISPTGRVPVLRVDDQVNIFESLVIVEFIDETVGEPLLAREPIKRAHERAWMQYTSGLLSVAWQYKSAGTESERAEARSELFEDLSRLEAELAPGDGFFSGPRFGLVDAAAAPFLMRLEAHRELMASREWDKIPRTRAWAARVLSVPAVKESVPADFAKSYLAL